MRYFFAIPIEKEEMANRDLGKHLSQEAGDLTFKDVKIGRKGDPQITHYGANWRMMDFHFSKAKKKFPGNGNEDLGSVMERKFSNGQKKAHVWTQGEKLDPENRIARNYKEFLEHLGLEIKTLN